MRRPADSASHILANYIVNFIAKVYSVVNFTGYTCRNPKDEIIAFFCIKKIKVFEPKLMSEWFTVINEVIQMLLND